jgi:bacterioferritin-associated ferredoxin
MIGLNPEHLIETNPFMYICLCHGVTKSAIRAAASAGARTFRQLSFATGCGTQCGSCAAQAQTLLEECLELQESRNQPPLLQINSAA